MIETDIKKYKKLDVTEVISLLGTSISIGLTDELVEKYRKTYGYNELPEKRPSLLLKFIKKFWGVTAWMLELIIVLSLLLHRQLDAYIVTGLLVFNAVISFMQELSAQHAVETLKSKLHVSSKVLRNGSWGVIPARELVPGDIVRIRLGDFIPADMKILAGDIEVDQSAVTGESQEVESTKSDVVYSGSIVVRGQADCVIALTGSNTFFGKTVHLVQLATPKAHIDDIVKKVSFWLLLIVGIFLGIAVISLKFTEVSFIEALPLSLVLLMSAIPVALPAMFTVSTALGSLELSKKGVLVTRLSSPDDAASMDILCVDKTGTLTENKISVAEVKAFGTYTKEEVILYGAMASQGANQDSIDNAFLREAKEKKLDLNSFIQARFVPFDPKLRRTEATVINMKNEKIYITKGSFQSVAKSCKLSTEEVKKYESQVGLFAQSGFKTIAVACKQRQDGKTVLIGLVALIDNPSGSAKVAISRLHQLGIKILMLTGDAFEIAKNIAQKVSIKGEILVAKAGGEFKKFDFTEELIENNAGFAEVYPEDKYTIVQRLQTLGHVVGMTGDGVNDSPALKQAEVGIAVRNATDVAKSSASLILTRGDSLMSIVEPIIVGRKIFQRINTWIINKISRTTLKVVFIIISFVLFKKIIISATAMLIMLFMTDFVKISLATDNVTWSQKPTKWNVKGLITSSSVLGVVMAIEAFGLLAIGLNYLQISINSSTLNTFVFEILFFFAIFSIFIAREPGRFWDSIPSHTMLVAISLDVLIAIVVSTFGLLGFQPISISITLFIIVYSGIFSLLVNDYIKRKVFPVR